MSNKLLAKPMAMFCRMDKPCYSLLLVFPVEFEKGVLSNEEKLVRSFYFALDQMKTNWRN